MKSDFKADGAPISLRQCVAAGLGCGAFVLLCLYRGPAVNLAVFTLAWGLLLTAATLLWNGRAWADLTQHRWVSVGALVAVAALIISYQISLSKADSFGPSLTIGLAIAGYLLGCLWGRALTPGLVVMSAVVVGFALTTLWDLAVYGATDRLFLDPNTFATLLLVTIIPWLHAYFLAVWSSRRLRVLMHVLGMLCLFVLVAALFSTHSRTGVGVLGAALLVWFVTSLAHKVAVWPVVACLVTSVFGYAFVNILEPGVASGEYTGANVVEGVAVRLALIGWCIDQLEFDRLFGIGIGTFPLLYRMSRPLADQDTAGFYVHNDYLQLLLEGGVLLFAALLAFSAFVALRTLDLLRRGPRDPRFSRAGDCMALMVAFTSAIVNFVFLVPFLSLSVGLVTARMLSAGTTRESTAVEGRISRPSAVLGLTLLGFGWVCWGFLCVDTVTAGVLAGQRGLPGVERARGDPGSLMRYARLAQRMNSNRGAPVLAEAMLLERQLNDSPGDHGLLLSAWEAYDRAAAADPWNPAIPSHMARFINDHATAAEVFEADETVEQMLTRSLAIDPLNVPAINAMFNLLAADGRDQAARSLLRERVLPWKKLLEARDPQAAARYAWLLERGET